MSTLNDHQENKILTQVKKVDAQHPDMTIIREAAEIIRTGGLVGFPTETVYGYVPVTLVEQIIEKHGGWFESKIPFA